MLRERSAIHRLAKGHASSKLQAMRRLANSKKPSPVKSRNFTLHWGSGVIAEEVRVSGPFHCPAIQLLEFREGPAAGARQIRFCYYDHKGRFQRSPLIVGEEEMEALAGALKAAPRLRAMLRRLAART